MNGQMRRMYLNLIKNVYHQDPPHPWFLNNANSYIQEILKEKHAQQQEANRRTAQRIQSRVKTAWFSRNKR